MEKERSLTNSTGSTNIYNSICVPELTFLDYSNSILPGEDRKPITITPVSNNPLTPAAPAPNNNNFLHEGKYLNFYTKAPFPLIIDAFALVTGK